MEELSDPPLAEHATPADAPDPSTPDHAAPPHDETTLPAPESAIAPPEASPAPLESAAPAPIEASPAVASESAAPALDEAYLPALNESIAPADEASRASADAASAAPLAEISPASSVETPAAAEAVAPQSSIEATAPAEIVSPEALVETPAPPAAGSAPPAAEAPKAPDTAQPDSSPAQTTDAPQRPLPIVRRIGAGMGMLGVLLVVGGALLPTHASGDYEAAALTHAPLILVGLLLFPAALILGISIFAWFRRPGLWLIVLGCLMVILATWVHWLVEALFAALSCFDICPAGGIHYGTGFWLPLIGFPLSGVGLVIVALTRFGRRRSQPAPTP